MGIEKLLIKISIFCVLLRGKGEAVVARLASGCPGDEECLDITSIYAPIRVDIGFKV